AIVDRDAAKAEGLGAPVFADAVEMAKAVSPDIIDIAAPPAAHFDLIAALTPLCRNLICQKPFCRDLQEAGRAVALAETAGARIIIHENIRHQPWYAEAARLIAAGAVGRPYEILFRLRPGDGQGPEAYLSRQPYFQKMPRFLIHETAVHWIDLFRAIFGEPAGVYADLRRLNPAIAGEDAGIAILDWPDGRRAVFDGNRLADHAATDRRRTMGEMLIEGESGALRLDGEGRIFLRRAGENNEREHGFEWTERNFGGDCVYISCLNYLDSFRSGAPNPTEAAAYLANLRIEEAMYLSAAEARRIAL
ncbi:MAG: Gfo/Idh/MocA family oxidoreductase, partial [Paracoccaceae bacterium]